MWSPRVVSTENPLLHCSELGAIGGKNLVIKTRMSLHKLTTIEKEIGSVCVKMMAQ